jgi:hypothetical protein
MGNIRNLYLQHTHIHEKVKQTKTKLTNYVSNTLAVGQIRTPVYALGEIRCLE